MMTPSQVFAVAYKLGDDHHGDAERIIDAWIRGAMARDIVRLGAAARASFRSGVWSHSVPLNEPIDPALLTQIAPRAPTSVACLLSTHRSGYVRELGTRYLATTSDTSAVPFLLLRTDDIVPSLRALAEHEIELRLSPEFAPVFARSLGILLTLRGRARGGGGPVVRRIDDFLCQAGCRDALVAASDDEDPVVRLLALALRMWGEPVATVLARALADRDTRNRFWAARAAISRATSDDDKRTLLPILEASGSAWTRALALRARQRLDADDAPLEAALLDHHAAVRYLARTLLRARHPDRAFGEARRGALATLARQDPTVAELVGALGALADVGLAADADAIARFANDARPRVRGEATRTLALLSG